MGKTYYNYHVMVFKCKKGSLPTKFNFTVQNNNFICECYI